MKKTGTAHKPDKEVDNKKPLNKNSAIVLTLLIILAVGQAERYIANNNLGSLWGVILVFIGLFSIRKVWQLAINKKSNK